MEQIFPSATLRARRRLKIAVEPGMRPFYLAPSSTILRNALSDGGFFPQRLYVYCVAPGCNQRSDRGSIVAFIQTEGLRLRVRRSALRTWATKPGGAAQCPVAPIGFVDRYAREHTMFGAAFPQVGRITTRSLPPTALSVSCHPGWAIPRSSQSADQTPAVRRSTFA